MQNRQPWYARCGNEVRGPFPAPQISRFILLGRIRESDELSTDQINWQSVSEMPILIPEELKADLSDPQAVERLRIARMREDERSARDRRDGEPEGQPVVECRRQSDNDRRRCEEAKILRHREIKTAIAEAARQRKQNYFLRGMLAAFVVSVIIAGAWYYQPWQNTEEIADCNALPQPWVNWNNCLMEGVQLAAADLRGARLRNTSLVGADLRGAQLGGADLAYSNLVGVKFSGTHLAQVTMVGANLRNADLAGAELQGANLAYIILQSADLREADFTGADLTSADLKGAMLKSALFAGANLSQAIWVDGRVCAVGSMGTCKR
jgi:hypothetical protein